MGGTYIIHQTLVSSLTNLPGTQAVPRSHIVQPLSLKHLCVVHCFWVSHGRLYITPQLVTARSQKEIVNLKSCFMKHRVD